MSAEFHPEHIFPEQPILLIHAYTETPMPNGPDRHSQMVADAAFELVRRGYISTIVLAADLSDKNGVTESTKIANYLTDRLTREHLTLPTILMDQTTAESTTQEILTLQDQLQRIYPDKEVTNIALLAIEPHAERRVKRAARRIFGQKQVKSHMVEVISAEDVLVMDGKYGEKYIGKYPELLDYKNPDELRSHTTPERETFEFIENIRNSMDMVPGLLEFLTQRIGGRRKTDLVQSLTSTLKTFIPKRRFNN
jgi:hypothetical protein